MRRWRRWQRVGRIVRLSAPWHGISWILDKQRESVLARMFNIRFITYIGRLTPSHLSKNTKKEKVKDHQNNNVLTQQCRHGDSSVFRKKRRSLRWVATLVTYFLTVSCVLLASGFNSLLVISRRQCVAPSHHRASLLILPRFSALRLPHWSQQAGLAAAPGWRWAHNESNYRRSEGKLEPVSSMLHTPYYRRTPPAVPRGGREWRRKRRERSSPVVLAPSLHSSGCAGLPPHLLRGTSARDILPFLPPAHAVRW